MKYSVSGKLINVPNHLDTLDTVGSPQPEATSLAARADRYRNEVEQVVRNVGEHPQYELKRSYDLSNLHQRMEFVKDIQAIATSQIDSEKFLVIGADEATRQFVAVTNVQEFDEARVRQQLERYLSPVPRFEIFHLRTADTVPFVLIVLGKQPTRRILARATVDDQTEMKPRLLLREGDLWTKGDSTGKRLARPEDWDAIYEEAIERETETRTRARTDHVVQQVVAQERIRAVSGGSFVFPAYLADEEFNVVVEEICARGDRARLAILLERLRDDLIEGWHKQGAYDKGLFQADPGTIPAFQEASRIQRDGVFRPAMRRLTMLCNSIVKFRGSIPLFETSLELIRETFNTSHRLHALRLATPRGIRSDNLDDHLSHTLVALESLVAVYIIGAYLAKRRRFDYFRPLLDQQVLKAGRDTDEQTTDYLMAMWPLQGGWGEPKALGHGAGRVDLCVNRIRLDPQIAQFFGDENDARTAVIEFEFLVELNSFLAVSSKQAPESHEYMREKYPTIDFAFRPGFIAFDLRRVAQIAAELFAAIESSSIDGLSKVLFDPQEASMLSSSAGRRAYLDFVRGLGDQHERLMLELNRFPGYIYWPKRLQDALNALPRGQQ